MMTSPNPAQLQTLQKHLIQDPAHLEDWLALQPNWSDLIATATSCPTELLSASITESIQQAGLHLLRQDQYSDGLMWLRTLPTPNPVLATQIISLATTYEAKYELEPAIQLREIALEWDPSSHQNLFFLIALAATSEDDWRVAIYSQTLIELWSSRLDPDPPRLRDILSMAVPNLLERRYTESFFEILNSYCISYLSQNQIKAMTGLLFILSKTYLPDITEQFEQGWDPADLKQEIIRDSIRFFETSTVRCSSLLAEFLDKEARKMNFYGQDSMEHREKQFHLMVETIGYFVLSSDHAKARESVSFILQNWPIFILKKLIPEPGVEKGTYHFLFDLTFKFCFYFPYLIDDRSLIRDYQKIAERGLSLDVYYKNQNIKKGISSLVPKNEAIRVGYLCIGFNKHPVGYLSYQSIIHHDPAVIQSYCYDISLDIYGDDDPILSALRNGVYCYRDQRKSSWEGILEQIRMDRIDILVSMDASTSMVAFEVFPFRAAPIQMTWLGGDSPAIPEVDYFIVDPYILPDDAQADYDETLLRLPTFAAVDSFEIGELDPEQARHNLDVPLDAVLFWTAANAAKRSPESIQAQLEILKNVPNGILAIKGLGDTVAVAAAYRQIAQAKGVEDRLRFIKTTHRQEDHRAQLTIADLVLDTFPYTGATHTFEALYVGTPVLTLVGRHYYGRMSYSLLKNCRLEDCITHSINDYIQRGIQLGSDREYLARVKAQVRASRATSPIWDAKGFARSLEEAYRQAIEAKLKEQKGS